MTIMKTFADRQSTNRASILFSFAMLFMAAETSATAQNPSPATGTPLAASSPVSSIEDYAVVSRGPNHAIRERTVYEPGSSGRRLVPRVHHVTELASGLNHLNDRGEWEPSRDDFEITSEGYAVARHCQHKLLVAPNLNSPRGVLDCQAPDGARIRTAVLGLLLFDPTSGRTVQVASVKDCPGQQTAPNEITFPDAFQGLKAAVRIRNERGRFHEEVLLSEKLTPAQLARLGFSPDSVRLEIWTEFLESPTPSIHSTVLKAEADPARRATMVDPDAVDDFLDFSALKMTRGAAFIEGRPDPSIPIFKRWFEQSGRHFLIEACDYSDLAPLLRSLPETAQFTPGARTKGVLAQSTNASSIPLSFALRTPPDRPAANPARNFQIARLDPSLVRPSAPQVNLDFTMLTAVPPVTFFRRMVRIILVQASPSVEIPRGRAEPS
jgi:hypothetical protein